MHKVGTGPIISQNIPKSKALPCVAPTTRVVEVGQLSQNLKRPPSHDAAVRGHCGLCPLATLHQPANTPARCVNVLVHYFAVSHLVTVPNFISARRRLRQNAPRKLKSVIYSVYSDVS